MKNLKIFTLGIAIAMLLPNILSAQKLEPVSGQPLEGSMPSFKSGQDMEDQVLYQRAFEAVIWSMPAVSKLGFRRSAFAVDGDNNTILAYSRGAGANLEGLTTNFSTPYVSATTDLRKGPVVLEVPKATENAILFGQIADDWFITFADIGPIGLDEGKGKKILLLPPNFKEKVPDGYINLQSPSYLLDFAFRSIALPPNGTEADAYELSRSIKMYYLSELPDPAPTKVIDPADMLTPTLPYYDERWFEDLHEIVNAGPVRERDKAMMGMLKTIGIEPGKPFNPDDRTKKILRQAATDAWYYMQQKFLKVHPDELWWPDRRWRDVFITDANNGFSYDMDDLLDYDERSIRPWFTATYFPAQVAAKPSTMYVTTAHDADGNLMVPGKTYSLTVQADVPVDQFWSLSVYDMNTWAMIYNPQKRYGIDSQDTKGMKKNDDGSVTIYIGPKAPKGLESNWIPTMNKAPYLMFRFYGPTDTFFDRSFKLNDVKLRK